MKRRTTEVLGHQRRLDGDDGYELFLGGVAEEPVRYPVYEVTLRVALTTSAGVPRELAREALEEAAELLLGGPRPAWWRRWLASEAEKARGMRWRVRS